MLTLLLYFRNWILKQSNPIYAQQWLKYMLLYNQIQCAFFRDEFSPRTHFRNEIFYSPPLRKSDFEKHKENFDLFDESGSCLSFQKIFAYFSSRVP